MSAAIITRDGVADQFGDPARVYELASVTKPLVAYAVLVAVEEGAVELDDPAGPSGSTLAHLLSHASGLAYDTREVEAPPGEQRIYSSAGFEVASEVVAEAIFEAIRRDAREVVLERVVAEGFLVGDVLLEALDELLLVILLGAT